MNTVARHPDQHFARPPGRDEHLARPFMSKVLAGLQSLLVLLALGGPGAAALAQDQVAIPALQSHVTDKAGMLSSQQRENLDQVLKDYEARTGSQVAVLTVTSTAPEAIEQYGIRVAEAWKLGRSGVDDGVILIVAKDNPSALRRLRIEAGRGVQGSLTDAQSKRILQDVIAPHFRQNDFYGGMVAGVSAITGLLDAEKLPQPKSQQQAQEGDGINWSSVVVILLFFMVTTFLRSRGSRSLNSSGWGRTSGVILGSAIGSALGRSGGGGGFGGGGGGFSGGGGTFDGGGASGDW
jgi:uncharacterized protein